MPASKGDEIWNLLAGIMNSGILIVKMCFLNRDEMVERRIQREDST